MIARPEPAPPAPQPPPSPRPLRAGVPLPVERRRGLDWLKALFLAVTVTAVLYEVVLPILNPGRLSALLHRSTVQLIAGGALWAAFLLLGISLRLRRQVRLQRALSRPPVWNELRAVLPVAVAGQGVEAAAAVLHQGKIKRWEESLLFRRLTRAVQARDLGMDREQLTGHLTALARLDERAAEADFGLPDSLLWILPLLGLAGTLLAAGQAVQEFSALVQSVDAAGQLGAQLRAALAGMSAGLLQAFDTLLLSIGLVVPLVLAALLLRREEQAFLLSVEGWCLQELVPALLPPARLPFTAQDAAPGRLREVTEAWLATLEPAVSMLLRHAELVGQQLAGVQPLIQRFTDRLLEPRPRAAPPGPPGPPEQEQATPVEPRTPPRS